MLSFSFLEVFQRSLGGLWKYLPGVLERTLEWQGTVSEQYQESVKDLWLRLWQRRPRENGSMGVRSFVFPVSAETREFHPMNEIVEWSSAKKQRSRHFTGAAHFSEWPGSDETARRWLRLPPPHCSALPYHCSSETESNKNEERKNRRVHWATWERPVVHEHWRWAP